MGVFINPFTDVGFKRIFGQDFSKPLLLDFLNNLLVGERKINNITFLDKEQLRETEWDRSIIYDILCETDTGEKIIVEMQNRHQPSFVERSIYYASKAIVRQGERGIEWNYDIKAVYLVAFLNFSLADVGNTFRTDVSLMNMKTKEKFSDKLRFIYLQLPYFCKEADECENDFERWIYVLRNMETINRLPWAAKNAVFKRLEEIAEVSALSQEERIKYDIAIKRYRDSLNVYRGAILEGREKGLQEGREKGLQEGREKGLQEGMEKGLQEGREKGLQEGREKGLQEGRVEGRAEGIREEKLSIAQNMKAMGMTYEQIAQACGITTEEAKNILTK